MPRRYYISPALRDFARELGLVVRAARDVLELAHDEETVAQHASEYDVLVVEPLRLGARDEELAPVAVRPAVRHGEEPRPGVPADEILIRELAPVDAHAPRAVALEEVPALDHEVLDHAVELRALVPLRLQAFLVLARAELPKVLRRPRAHVREELHLHAPSLHPADGDVEKNHRVGRVGRARVPLLLRHRESERATRKASEARAVE